MKNKLKIYRAIYDLTQDDLAIKIGVSRQTINAIEKEKYNPSLLVALKISKAVNANVEEIFQLEEEV